ncbi:hypothetical protein [Thiomicrorhabdus xiamenensis]|uniref:Uncharacterized protein n=1 Tax=Thiomicrorhabdus xiamenensis TaxID=2739063 RepID=A0A7D4NYM3_9GAMM|nr:hypothetical protein [Thiomicrorhabdus xiamenensis]QKI89218.1 hypothetical protein HQN79_06395 [Thiomicrorhabdus xiamenensis]
MPKFALMPPFNSMRLHLLAGAANIGGTTKLYEATRTAFKPCFFYAQNLWIAVSKMLSSGMENRFRIIKNAGGLIGLNTRPFTGNKSSRHIAVVETRPPVINAGGQTLTKLYGGQSYA